MMKEVFEKLIRNALANDPPGEKDFTGKNGLLCCGEAGRSTVMTADLTGGDRRRTAFPDQYEKTLDKTAVL